MRRVLAEMKTICQGLLGNWLRLCCVNYEEAG